MVTRRSRVVAAPRDQVWELIADPYHHPRWWPRVERVEGVTARGWTNVLLSARGNTVRTDWSVETNLQPTQRRWAQEIEGTPFERLFRYNAVDARLEHAEGGGTRVTLAFDQQPRGLARLLPFLIKRPMGRQLDEALDNLDAVAG
jgi:uncharacterized protein YndB with AHSA1/START domain